MGQALAQLFRNPRWIPNIQIQDKLSKICPKSSKRSSLWLNRLLHSNSNYLNNSCYDFNKHRISHKLGNNSSFYKTVNKDRKRLK